MMTCEKLNEAYYLPDHLWTSSEAIRELYRTTSIPKKDTKSWLAKDFHIPSPKEESHPN